MSKGKKIFKIVGGILLAALAFSNFGAWLLDDCPNWVRVLFGTLMSLTLLVYVGLIEYWNYNERTRMMAEQQDKRASGEDVDEECKGNQ